MSMRLRLASNAVLALASQRSAKMSLSTTRGSSNNSSSSSIGMKCVERKVTCSDGVTLSSQCWPAASPSSSGSTSKTRKILCLHGWLDNSASFHLLAPALSKRLNSSYQSSSSSSKPTEIVALDLPGHGLSSHKSKDGPPQILAEYCYYVSEFLDGLGWSNGGDKTSDEADGDDKIILLSHSMGAGISTTMAAAFPNLVDSIILLEGAGPLARRSEDTAKHIRNAVERRKRGNIAIYGEHGEGGVGDSVADIGAGAAAPSGTGSGGGKARKGVRVYPNLDAAVDVRVNTARLTPGNQYLSREAARAMVERATVSYVTTPAAQAALSAARAAGENVQGFTDESVVFRHDPRLQWPSLQYFTREQVDAIYADVKCPVCLISAQDGWPFGERERKSVQELLRPAYFTTLPGSHHFHADPDSFGAVFDEVVAFIER
mmetsp:Transcript_13158/g.28557  ORF Transcript_13158/g.28557 Transcript_13158/m.28557 type:complete len:432 (-) Transcript_13158:1427-2722(-)